MHFVRDTKREYKGNQEEEYYNHPVTEVDDFS
jgi:hypothetical protein